MPEKNSKKYAIEVIYRAAGLALIHGVTHFSNVNSSKSVWWFDLPLEKLKSENLGAIDLLAVSEDVKKLHHLRVPVSFLNDNLAMFHIREKKQCISLELSAFGGNQFQDVRPTSKRLQFKEFLIGTVELEKYTGYDLKQESFLGQKFEGGIKC